MKLQIASDLHIEFGHNPELRDVGANVLVLAGDIGCADMDTVDWLHDLSSRYEAVLYVAGNHEFYGKDLPEAVHPTRLSVPCCKGSETSV